MQSGLGLHTGLLTPSFPPEVDGTILISANEAAGQAWEPGELNSYRQFFDKQPDEIIADSVLVFHGSFDVSLAAALNLAAILPFRSGKKAAKQDDFPDSKQKSAVLIYFPNTIHKFDKCLLCTSSGNRCTEQGLAKDASLDRMPPILIRVRSESILLNKSFLFESLHQS